MSSPSHPAAVDPASLLRLGKAFVASRTFLSAVELDLFTHLETPLTARQIQAALHLHDRAIPDFPDALVALRVIAREGDGPDATYTNTPSSAAYLVRSSPAYLGAFMEMSATRLYACWGNLTDGLKTGCIQNEAKHRSAGVTMWAAIYASPEKLARYMNAMSSQALLAHAAFASTFDFKRANVLLDVGGATAQLCCQVAKRHPHMKCRSLDLPCVAPLAERNVAAHHAAKTVGVVSGDMWTDDFGHADIVTMSFVLHDYDLAKKKNLLRKAYDALPVGGRFVAIEMLIDDDRRCIEGLLMSLNMIVETDGGFDYTAKDFEGWAKEIGFSKCERIHLHHPVHAVVAYK